MPGRAASVCSACGRSFGGSDAYTRHLVRRQDRCRTDRELIAAGLEQDVAGVWHRLGGRSYQTALLDGRSARHKAQAIRGNRRGSHERGERVSRATVTVSGAPGPAQPLPGMGAS